MKAQIHHPTEGWVHRTLELQEGTDLGSVPVEPSFGIRWETPDNAGAPLGAPMDRTDLKAWIAQRRWEEETGGVEVASVPIRTDRESQAMITGALTLAALNPSAVFPWKTETGFVQLTVQQLQGVAAAVGSHVQECFAREAQLIALVEASDPAADRQILKTAIESFWPAE